MSIIAVYKFIYIYIHIYIYIYIYSFWGVDGDFDNSCAPGEGGVFPSTLLKVKQICSFGIRPPAIFWLKSSTF